MELKIDNLTIEVTRKCNMNCQHCMRGPSQRKTIDDQHIYKILQLIDNVNTLTITGGEPTLAMDSLEQIRTCIIYGSCSVGNFYMVTNGKAINVDELAEWSYSMLNCCNDNEMSTIGFSFDPFHKETLNWKQLEKLRRNYYNLKEKLEYDYGVSESGHGGDFVCEHSNDNWDYHSLIREGRAKDSGSRDNNIEFFVVEDCPDYMETDCIDFRDTQLYLSSNGYLVAGCDWSYHSIDNREDIRIAHIDDIRCTDDLIEALKTYNEKAEKTVIANEW